MQTKEDTFSVEAPAKGGNAVKYLKILNSLTEILKKPEVNSVPGTSESLHYATQVAAEIQQLRLSGLAFRNTLYGAPSAGSSYDFEVFYTSPVDRDVLISFCNKDNNCYDEERIAVKADLIGSLKVKRIVPATGLTEDEMKTTYFTVKLVPTGKDWTQKLAEEIVRPQFFD